MSQHDNFYLQYADFLGNIGTTFKNLQDFYKDQTRRYEDTKIQAGKDTDYVGEAEEAIRVTQANLLKQTKYMEELRARMKEVLSKIDPKKLAKFKIKEHESEKLMNFFKSFFVVYYKETNIPFDWNQFKEEAILKDHLEDFQSRLVNADFSSFTDQDLITLSKIKEDPWLNEFVIKRKRGGLIIELLNYVEFVSEAVKSDVKVKQMQNMIAKLKKDLPKRTEKAKAGTVNAEVVKDNLNHLSDLNNTVLEGSEIFKEEIALISKIVHQHGLGHH